MNEQFSLKRFPALFRKVYTENAKPYAVGGLILLGALILLRLVFRNPNMGYQVLVFTWIIFFAGNLMWVIRNMKMLRTPKQAVVFNTLPVSQFEKFLFILLNTTIGYLLLFSLCYGIAVIVSGVPLEEHEKEFFQNHFSTSLLFAAFFIMNILYVFAGMTRFRNHTFVCFLVLFGLYMALITGPIILSSAMMEYISSGTAGGYSNFTTNILGTMASGTVVEGDTEILFQTRSVWPGLDGTRIERSGIRIIYILKYVVWLFFAGIAYLKLTERQLK